jgi:predicted kinase
MKKLLMLKGLPASGKSTYAKQLVRDQEYYRVNKDDLRAMVHDSRWGKEREKFILHWRDEIVKDSLGGLKNVVVDDTNFAGVHEVTLRAIAAAYKAKFEVKFFDTPVEECIQRDLLRPNSVGSKVIMQMYNQYLKPVSAEPPAVNPELPWAVLCDIDGTLAHMVNRGPHDASEYLEDEKDERVHWAFARLAQGASRIIWSGRSAEYRADTEKWLADHGITYDLLLMRSAGDVRKDSIVKRELYEQHIKGKYNVRLVLDDRNQVVDMERDELGLRVFQVAPGDF